MIRVLLFLSLLCFGMLHWSVTTSHAEEFDGMSVYQLPTKWETQNGDHIDFSDLKGNILVVVMIYTSCRSACPVLIGQLKNIAGKIESKHAEGVKYVLVSIDPERDTPDRLKKISIEYDMTSNKWLFLRGNAETTREFANVLAVRYTKISPKDFSHSNIVSVFDRKGILVHQREGLNVDNKETVDKVLSLLAEE